MKQLKYLVISLFTLGLLVFNSCLSNSVTNYSDDARVYSFGIKSDSVPAFAKAKFTVDQTGGSAYKTNGLIYNADSLPFKTKLYGHFRAIPVISTYSSAAMFFNKKTYKSGDSIDFRTKQVLLNYAANGTDTLSYYVDVRVHQVEPDSIAWQLRTYPSYGSSETEQKAVYCNDQVMLFLNNGSAISMYSTTDAKSWNGGSTISTLPASASLQNMIVLNNVMYVIGDGQTIYSSTNGTSWNKITISSANQLKSLIAGYDNKLFAVMYDSSNNYYVETSSDGANWSVQYPIANIELNYNNGNKFNSFPISDFAATTFQPQTGSPKLMLIGGKDKAGSTVNSVYTYMAGTGQWMDFSTEIKADSFPASKNASLIWYDNRLMLWGGTNASGAIAKDTLLCSKTEGYIWTRRDTLVNFPKVLNYKTRTKASVVVDKYNRIFMIGGKDANGNFIKEAWVGRKNKLGFGLSAM
ncbi:DUF6242 domain-containing protein [Paludibacter jiangxiensis]|uniref:Uncharacterized protein n=1 Tax=Paludibacter jiangxiensis TaxID=681398 RepID=A0A161LCP0_9BACT|nr:DUF6242 domain-containing protein [Paludibacter jiangxiensis]GAT61635.1 hypothetical protein PJIAN_1215 [Paludibacter jiangxiensis]